MKVDSLFQNYELLADGAEAAFNKVAREYPGAVKCKPGCTDCCHAVFGLFLVEAAYLKFHFDQLPPEIIKDALLRCNEAERAIKRLEVKLRNYREDPEMQAYVYATSKVRCPLLDHEGRCVLYPRRPITCRAYGIPTRIRGKTRVCTLAGFEQGKSYEGYNLDQAYQQLFFLSREFLASYGKGDPGKADLLISVPKVLTTPLELLIEETFQ